MSTHSGRERGARTIRAEVLRRVGELFDPDAPAAHGARVAEAVRDLDAGQLEVVRGALEQVVDLEDRTVRDVFGRDGRPVAVHHFRACRAEDDEASWDFRPPSPPIRTLRDALLDALLGRRGLRVEGVEGLVGAEEAGRRFLFVSNHESVFDLAVLPRALRSGGLGQLSERIAFFVNPKIFNKAFVNFFICKPIGLIKVPQNPRIAANESVMEAEEVLRRAGHGFDVAGARLAAGDSLAIYPEGLRSGGVLHRFAKAYLDLLRPGSLEPRGLSGRDVLLAPWAHRGVRTLEAPAVDQPEVEVRFGRPIEAEEFFGVVGSRSPGVAGHLAGHLVARLLPEDQRGLYGADPAAYLDHPHFRLRLRPHTLAEVEEAGRLVEAL